MQVSEIFYSIQGEGVLSGYPTVFVRLWGCNLRCSYCDTRYTYEEPGTEMDIDEILKEVGRYKTKRICITGGEPLIQNETIELIDRLLKMGCKLSLETNGSKDISMLTERLSDYGDSLMISLDIKCPSSGMHEKMNLSNIDRLRSYDQLKFVVGNREDYDYARTIMERYRPECTILFQPVFGTDPKRVAEWLLRDALNARISLQLHKIIWGEGRKL